jgi:hypothetical protein
VRSTGPAEPDGDGHGRGDHQDPRRRASDPRPIRPSDAGVDRDPTDNVIETFGVSKHPVVRSPRRKRLGLGRSVGVTPAIGR